WRSLRVSEAVRDGIDKVLMSRGVFGVAAIDGITGEFRSIAEVLTSADTVGATSIGLVQPWNPDARAYPIARGTWAQAIDGADDLMSGNNAVFPRRQLALNHVKVGPADTAGVNSNQNFLFPGLRNWKLAQLERKALDWTGVPEHTRLHGC